MRLVYKTPSTPQIWQKFILINAASFYFLDLFEMAGGVFLVVTSFQTYAWGEDVQSGGNEIIRLILHRNKYVM